MLSTAEPRDRTAANHTPTANTPNHANPSSQALRLSGSASKATLSSQVMQGLRPHSIRPVPARVEISVGVAVEIIVVRLEVCVVVVALGVGSARVPGASVRHLRGLRGGEVPGVGGDGWCKCPDFRLSRHSAARRRLSSSLLGSARLRPARLRLLVLLAATACLGVVGLAVHRSAHGRT